MVNAQEKCIDINKRLVTVLDDLLAAGNWEASLFLKATAKQVKELRDRANQLLLEVAGISNIVSAQQTQERVGQIKVFISVYQTEHNNLGKWHQTLKALTEYSVSRPVYRDEEHVKQMIRAKENILREAYAVAYVKETDVIALPSGRVARDRWNNELLTLKPGAVRTTDIIEFAHAEKCYYFAEKELVLK